MSVIAACGQKGNGAAPAGQVIARVNNHEITLHQLTDESTPAAVSGVIANAIPTRDMVDRLIDEQLLVDLGTQEKLDHDPVFLHAIEKASRQIIAQMVQDDLASSLPQPTEAEMRGFYEANPALFAKRRIYIFNQFIVDRAAFDTTLRTTLDRAKTRDDVISALKAQKISFSDAVLVRPAEQLPMPALPFVTGIKRGRVMVINDQQQANILQLIDFVEQPATLQQATPAIREYLVNAKKKEFIAERLKKLRAAGNITYVGPFAAEPTQTATTDDKIQPLQSVYVSPSGQQPRQTVVNKANRASSPVEPARSAPSKRDQKLLGTTRTAEGSVVEYGRKDLAGNQN